MAVTSGFFDSQNGDRKYSAQQMGELFDGLILDGVYRSVYDSTGGNKLPFKVIPGDGLSVKIRKGRAWCRNTWIYNSSDYSLSLGSAPSSGLKRYDAIVLRFNSDTRANTITRIAGTAVSGNPTYPALTNNTNVKDMAIAYVLVEAGATAITQAKIVQTVIGNGTPYVTSPTTAISIAEYVADWANQFTEWRAEQTDRMETFMSNISGLLSEDQAGVLHNMINQVGRIQFQGTFDGTKYANKYVEARRPLTGMTVHGTTTSSGTINLYAYINWNSAGVIATNGSVIGTWTLAMYEDSTKAKRIGPEYTIVAYQYGLYGPYKLGTDKKITVTFDNAAFNGLTCTLKNGSETYTAVVPNSGTRQVVFDVQTAGTWTASITAGGKTYSGSVSASAAGNYTIAIKYITELVILSSSVDKTGAASKVSGDSSAVASKSGGKLILKNTGYAENCEYRWPINADLTQYKTIKLTFAKPTGSGGSVWWRVGTSTSANKQTTTGTVTVNISALSGSGNYIYLGYSGFGGEVEISVANISVLP